MPRIKYTVEIIIEPDGRAYHAYCPALKGIHVDGRTKKETLSHAKEAVQMYMKPLVKHGDPIPVGVDLENCGDGKVSKAKRPTHSHHIESYTMALA